MLSLFRFVIYAKSPASGALAAGTLTCTVSPARLSDPPPGVDDSAGPTGQTSLHVATAEDTSIAM